MCVEGVLWEYDFAILFQKISSFLFYFKTCRSWIKQVITFDEIFFLLSSFYPFLVEMVFQLNKARILLAGLLTQAPFSW